MITIEIALGLLLPAGVDFACVETAPRLRILQQIVGGGNFDKARFSGRIIWVDVRMAGARQLAISLLDLLGAGGLLHPEDGVGIVLHVTDFKWIELLTYV